MSASPLTRRELLHGAGALVGAAAFGGLLPLRAGAASKNPTSPVSIARCREYDQDVVTRQLGAMFDQLGGIQKLVAGKTVAVKVNLTGHPSQTALGLPASRTFQIHPTTVLGLATLLDRAGAKRIRFIEGTYQTRPMEDVLTAAKWDLQALGALKAQVDYEDTRNRGKGKQYHRVKVPGGGLLFPAYELNHSYVDCDVYISLAKLKNHATAGVTLSMKNNFGITPTALYGHHEPDENTTSNRGATFHNGNERPADGLPQEIDPNSPRKPTYRVPRHTVDATAMRPIDLAIIDGVETMSGGEGPWNGPQIAIQKAGLLLAGRNPVCTDAVATAVMGYDPMAKHGTGPFPGYNHLVLAHEQGMGAIDPKQIEVRGLSIQEALHPFKWEPTERNW